MKISELIEKLQEFKKEHGDLEVTINEIRNYEDYPQQCTCREIEIDDHEIYNYKTDTFEPNPRITLNGWD